MLINTSKSLNSSLNVDGAERNQVTPAGFSVSEYTNSLLTYIVANSKIVDSKLHVKRLDIASFCYSATRDLFLSYPYGKRGLIELSGSDFNECAEEAINTLRCEGWSFTLCSLSPVAKSNKVRSTLGLAPIQA